MMTQITDSFTRHLAQYGTDVRLPNIVLISAENFKMV